MGLRTGSITFGGLSSGIPTADIIDQLLQLEQRPIDLLEAKKASFEEKLSVYQDLNSKTRALRDLLRDLDNMNLLGTDRSVHDEFSRVSASSSAESVATATASGTAPIGNLTFRVNQIATGERSVSQGYSALTDTIDSGGGSGSITITIDGQSEVINLDATNNTLEGFTAAINDLDLNVRAFIINDGSAANPYRIAIQSTETGASQAIDIALAGVGGGTADPVFTETMSAQDAQLTIDPGVNEFTVSSARNTFSEVIAGLTIVAHSAQDVADAPVTVSIQQDADAMAATVAEVVTKYNEIIEGIAEQFKVDPTTNRGGPLMGDSTLRSLQRRLGSVIASAIGAGTITASVQIGLELDRNGKLKFDESEFKAAIAADPNGVKAFFAGSGSFADQLRSVADVFVDPVDGFFTARVNGTTTSIQGLDEDIQQAEDRLSTVEANLIRQFAALERVISGIQAQGNFLNQFLLTNTQ
jgi:flagellar hook-associated protein 2